jgi:hypothetical protein
MKYGKYNDFDVSDIYHNTVHNVITNKNKLF